MNYLTKLYAKMPPVSVAVLAGVFLACANASDAESQRKTDTVTATQPAVAGPGIEAADGAPGEAKKPGTTLTPLTDKELDALRARASSYLEAIRINDIASAYRMELGSGDGSLTPLRFNQIRPGGRLWDYAIEEALIENGEGVVKTKVRVILPQMRTPFVTTWDMRWVIQDGVLYHKSRQPEETPGLGSVLGR
jgi:hypothetical protein